MEAIKKIGRVFATILPRHTLSVDRNNRRAYVVVMEREWLARVTRVEVEVRDAEKTDMNLLDLL